MLILLPPIICLFVGIRGEIPALFCLLGFVSAWMWSQNYYPGDEEE